jgi:hypothetical protein
MLAELLEDRSILLGKCSSKLLMMFMICMEEMTMLQKLYVNYQLANLFLFFLYAGWS